MPAGAAREDADKEHAHTKMHQHPHPRPHLHFTVASAMMTTKLRAQAEEVSCAGASEEALFQSARSLTVCSKVCSKRAAEFRPSRKKASLHTMTPEGLIKIRPRRRRARREQSARTTHAHQENLPCPPTRRLGLSPALCLLHPRCVCLCAPAARIPLFARAMRGDLTLVLAVGRRRDQWPPDGPLAKLLQNWAQFFRRCRSASTIWPSPAAGKGRHTCAIAH